jgi:hypothetical protein
VLFLSNPPGVDRSQRRRMLVHLETFNRRTFDRLGDPDTQTRIDQYEMAFRMQSSVPELTVIGGESKATLEMYGPEATKPGTTNVALARAQPTHISASNADQFMISNRSVSR